MEQVLGNPEENPLILLSHEQDKQYGKMVERVVKKII
jgi:hypothetical protein